MMDSFCDLCGGEDAAEIGIVREYTDDQPLYVCRDCGFVYAKERRSGEEIAADWDSRPGDEVYAASLAATEARHSFVARFAQGYLKKKVVDIGAGDGRFLKLLKDRYGTEVFGISPSEEECQIMADEGIPNFHGMAHECKETGFHCATLLWTLENTGSCTKTIQAAREMAEYVLVATGSRLFVPFKKPIGYYFGKSPVDLHPWRFSHKTLTALMRKNAIEPIMTNRYIDSDYLVMVGRRVDKPLPWTGDDYREVLHFFRKWHWATKGYEVV